VSEHSITVPRGLAVLEVRYSVGLVASQLGGVCSPGAPDMAGVMDSPPSQSPAQ
jgi:hypothetical protein